ncbi:MAG TPA: hypothetical protein VMG10_12810 [Gemmataceae bacterium]|nr:hypothetical protein [Gemmataceae bacterium]
MPVICEGCGQRVSIPEGYRRNKIQCACGVICAVPESARQEAGEPAPKRAAAQPNAAEEQAERWLLDDPSPSPPPSEPPPFREPEPMAAPAPARKPAVSEMLFPCRRCRRPVRRQGECPDCNPGVRSHTEPRNEENRIIQEPVWWPSVDEPGDKDDEEDSSPYGVEGGEGVKCPKCCFLLPPDSVLCVRCGFHLKKRKKVARAYQPTERVWETSAPYRTRLMAFVSCEAAGLALGLTGVFWGGADLGVFIGAFLGLTAMLAFLFGSYDRIHLTRDPRGRVQLTKTWRVAFFALPPQTIDVWSYEGIVSGRHREISAWEYLIFFLLLFCAVVPGIIWWYLAIYKVTFHVSLSRDHGFPSYILYSGWSEMQMKEIAYTLRDASGLLYDEG